MKTPPLLRPAARVAGASLSACALLLTLALAGCESGGSDDGGSPPANPNPPANPQPPTTPEPPPPSPPVFFFGAQTHFGQGWNLNPVPRLVESGMLDVRDELYWQIVEPTAGNFRFPANYDAYMDALRVNGIAPLIEFTFENPHYDGGQTPYTDAGFNAYARYATEVIRRYGAQIQAVEIWNEYNGTFAKGPATADRAGTYFKMLRAAHAALKAERPDLTVLGGATAGVPLPYFEKLFAAGALNHLDAVSIHPYRTASGPEGLELQVAALQTLMAKYGGVKPVWVTEIGWPLHAAAAPGDLAVDETTQAAFLVRACVLLASAGVHHVYWYQFRDDNADPDMGLVKNDAGHTPRKAFSALKTLNAQLRHATFVARERTDDQVYSLRFTAPGGRERRVLWALTPFTVSVPAGTVVTDMFGASITPASGSLTVAGSPVFITGPLPNLPGSSTVRNAVAVTESSSAFSLQQGAYGWHYGYFVGPGAAFTALRDTRITDWKEEWTDRYAAISITNVDQHPSATGDRQPVSVVRRWISTVDGNIHVAARFKVGLQGDGVRVRVLVDGQTLHTATLSRSTSIAADFVFERAVRAGTVLDFAVDPGAAADLGNDATQVAVTIERAD